jgi:hypothetical protein
VPFRQAQGPEPVEGLAEAGKRASRPRPRIPSCMAHPVSSCRRPASAGDPGLINFPSGARIALLPVRVDALAFPGHRHRRPFETSCRPWSRRGFLAASHHSARIRCRLFPKCRARVCGRLAFGVKRPRKRSISTGRRAAGRRPWISTPQVESRGRVRLAFPSCLRSTIQKDPTTSRG